MLEGLFRAIVSMGIKGSIIALFIIVIRFTFGRRLPKNFSYYLWFAVLVRLIFPTNFVSRLSLFNYIPESNTVMDRVIIGEVQRKTIPNITINNASSTITDIGNATTSVSLMEKFIFAAAILWIVGLAFLILHGLIKYYKASKILEMSNIYNFDIEELKRKVKIRRNINVYTLCGIESPMVYKFFRPRIIIPNSMKDTIQKEESKHILIHELIHIKRYDNILKLIWVIVVAIYWFNPIIWLAAKLFNEDMELSCDENVMRIWGNDIRRDYANSLIDIADKQIHPLEQNFIGFGKTNIKTRIKNIMNYRKPKIWFTLFCITLIGLIMIVTLTNKDIKGKNDFTFKKIDFTFNNAEYAASPFKLKNISIKDKKIINDIMSMIENSETVKGKTKLEDMEKMNCNGNKLILTKKDGSKEEIFFSFDSLYEFGYVETGGKIKKPKYDFFRYMCNLIEYQKFDTNIEKPVLDLFKKYNWTVDYKINTLKEKLPENLKHNAGEYPVKIYWAYNNELSKQIGLNFRNYLGKNITAEIYILREPLPEFLKPQRNARGVILKYKDKIIGAYIDMGRHYSFACSLDRKSLENITEKNWDQWIENYINYDDELEIKLSKMKPEDIIKEHYKALDKNDTKMQWATITRKTLCQYLTSNMDNHYLFNKEKDAGDTNIKSVKLLEVKKLDSADNDDKTLIYKATADFKYFEFITSDDGADFHLCTMKKEAEKSGWRIAEMGK
ncbi:beta-lactamase regulating signal transducer with metallopeptidase domain [Clostridium tetanomorphum]|uniref:M56 family metallopeptidase n=1 Tax=Clostridium tetanomorphum TaxID=1553 RepID=UPI0004472848|nr:M56 family metallopeptidase [Clostridium tetanomorphum]KAJ52712.1 peptidase m56 blar1 [Clostridium tetanomorphum DSM 665]MBP1863305.1 beta-lactamase regulating signal transducer with metallopeptidase domain [Clostridium tetanomorphum]NRS84413.1 beta-lactamase regulating signal transducer with metallopeptidase domain [Clostridium tetanomorphum]SQB92110.1 peptidase M56, BlaR1 [Clostridium tetanomorphum]